jgi:hypothetical protein
MAQSKGVDVQLLLLLPDGTALVQCLWCFFCFATLTDVGAHDYDYVLLHAQCECCEIPA